MQGDKLLCFFSVKWKNYDISHHVSLYNLEYMLLIAKWFCFTERKRRPYYAIIQHTDLTLQHCAPAKVKSYTNELSNYVYNFRLDLDLDLDIYIEREILRL